jgi:hypothetical protein
MSAKVEDLYIEQGATFKKTIIIRNKAGVLLPISDWAFRGTIRTGLKAPTPTASFSFIIDTVEDGTVSMKLDADVTAGIPCAGEKYTAVTKYVYDVEAETTDGIVYRILNGNVTVSPEGTI